MSNPPSLRQLLATRDNNHRPWTRAFEHRTGVDWHTPTPANFHGSGLGRRPHPQCPLPSSGAGRSQNQRIAGEMEVIVIDDASIDDSTDIIAGHPRWTSHGVFPRGWFRPARNLGIELASASTVVFVDADMLLPNHVLADMGARATAKTVLLGFRHNRPAHMPPPTVDERPDLYADHRVSWTPPVGVPLMYSGTVVEELRVFHPLDDTDDLRNLGCGALYHDWDLPRMVVTALLGVPRQAVIDVGGFDPQFGELGWGCEDTHLGAKLIAHGLRIVPLRQAVGFHLDPPDADAQWKNKLASWPATMGLYRHHLSQPPPVQGANMFDEWIRPLVDLCEVLR